MKKMLLSFFLLVSLASLAGIRLPAIIGDHMVLQQNSTVKLWGWADPAEKITINVGWDTTAYFATGTAGAKWMAEIKTPSAGGPFKIILKASNEIILNDVMIGEVWVCSGQSNMEMHYNWGMKQYTEDVNNANNKSIRFFQVSKLTSDFPQDDLQGKWVVCSPESVKTFSMVGYFFGNRINQETSYPVGLINSSWGGTPAEVWTPDSIVNDDPPLKAAAAKLNQAPWWPVNAGATYNAMIYPIINYAIAGTIWYQGESNTGTASTYSSLFNKMIGSWRTAWKKDFPFYYVQIAPFTYGEEHIGNLLREAQTKSQSYPQTGMVVISDLVDNIKDIHPQLKKDVGLRLANYALGDHYKKPGIVYKFPQYRNMEINKNKVRVYFDHAENGLITKGGAPTEFYLAGADKQFHPAQAKIIGNTVELSSIHVKQPVAVRFGFSNTAMPNLFSKEGLPVNLFRTDDWEVRLK